MMRLAYLGYYVKKMNWPLLRSFMAHTATTKRVSRMRQIVQMVTDSLRYNVSPLEVHQFGFFGASEEEKARWAGTGTMYEFHRRANPPSQRDVLDDKARFHEAYRPFVRHEVATLGALERDAALREGILQRHERLVFKPARGNCGIGIGFVDRQDLDPETLTRWMRDHGYDLAEAHVRQHPDLDALSPSGVNTVRIFTYLDSQDRCQILGCRLRITVDSPVDNMAAGNLVAPVDEATGRVTGPAVYSDITRQEQATHPATGVAIAGFKVPFWPETLALVREATELHPQNRSIGWDLVITPNGPGLIEGNHDWCKLVWQLPVKQGLKAMLDSCA